MEIEKKFLLKAEYIETIKNSATESHLINQYYVRMGNVEERYRKCDGNFFHTIKKSVDKGLKREEIEERCPSTDYYNNVKIKIGNVIEKTRYIYFYDEKKFEIDIYSGALAGLSVCEIEFDSEEEANEFSVPEFAGEEITFDKRYKNQSLAIYGRP